MKTELKGVGVFGKVLGNRRVIAAAVAVLLAGGTALAIGQHKAQPPTAVTQVASPAITVNVVLPVAAKFDRMIGATGTVMARDELIIGSDASGVRLTEVLVEIGAVVRKGDLLARADDAQLRAQLAQQQAALKQAQADFAQAQANLERSESLKDSGVYSTETLQVRRTTAQANAAKVELVQAQVRELEVRLAQTRVYAPAAGVISKKTATVGAVVQPGSELFRMIRNGELEWHAELPSHSIAKIAPGSKVRVLLEEGQPIEAKVRLVAPTMDASTRNGMVHVTLPHGVSLKVGQHARGEILVDNTLALALPEASVLMRDGYSFAYIVGGDSIARLTRIETGARRGGMVEVREGLDPQARVIGTGAAFVKDGDLVRMASEPTMKVVQSGERS